MKNNKEIKDYNLIKEKIFEAININEGLNDLENGKIIDGEVVFNEIKNKYGFKNVENF